MVIISSFFIYSTSVDISLEPDLRPYFLKQKNNILICVKLFVEALKISKIKQHTREHNDKQTHKDESFNLQGFDISPPAVYLCK